MSRYSSTLSDARVEIWSNSAERYQLVGEGLEALDCLDGEPFARSGITMAEALVEISQEPNAPRVTDVDPGLGRIWLLYGSGNRRLRVTLRFDGKKTTLH